MHSVNVCMSMPTSRTSLHYSMIPKDSVPIPSDPIHRIPHDNASRLTNDSPTQHTQQPPITTCASHESPNQQYPNQRASASAPASTPAPAQHR